MLEYNISGRCPHCGGLTHLEEMDELRYERAEPALQSILHTLICRHCSQRFGTSGGQIVKERQNR